MPLVDSDILIDVLRLHPPAIQWMTHLRESLFVPGFVAMELYNGTASQRDLKAVDDLLRPCEIVWPSIRTCNDALRHHRDVHLSNAIGIIDVMNAYISLERVTPLFTFDVKHYRAITNLRTIQPYTR